MWLLVLYLLLNVTTVWSIELLRRQEEKVVGREKILNSNVNITVATEMFRKHKPAPIIGLAPPPAEFKVLKHELLNKNSAR